MRRDVENGTSVCRALCYAGVGDGGAVWHWMSLGVRLFGLVAEDPELSEFERRPIIRSPGDFSAV